jgi:outer membrane immunogenic protein
LTRNFVYGAAALAFAATSPAWAQLSEDQPFSGFYVGLSGGYDVQSSDRGSAIGFDRDNNGTFNDPVLTATGQDAFLPGYCDGRAQGPTQGPNGCENDRNRGSYYVRAGADRQFGPWVVGVVGEFGRTDIRDYVSAFSTTPASYTFGRGIDWEASARLRAGFAAKTTLFYATGGVGYAHIKHQFFTTNTANAFEGNGDSKELGFVVGGGIEQKITQNISFGLEYSYHDYHDDEFRVLVTQGSAAATNPFVLAPNTSTTFSRLDPDFRWHSLRATLNYRF